MFNVCNNFKKNKHLLFVNFVYMNDVKGKTEYQLKAMLDKPNLPEKIRKDIEKKLAYINKPIRK